MDACLCIQQSDALHQNIPFKLLPREEERPLLSNDLDSDERYFSTQPNSCICIVGCTGTPSDINLEFNTNQYFHVHAHQLPQYLE